MACTSMTDGIGRSELVGSAKMPLRASMRVSYSFSMTSKSTSLTYYVNGVPRH